MKLSLQIAFLFGICLLGEVISALISPYIKFPASVIAMILLSVLLIFKVLKRKKIREVTNFFLDNISFFYLPACVGIIDQLGVVKDYILQIALICIVSTALTFAATAYTVTFVMKIQNKIMSGREKGDVNA